MIKLNGVEVKPTIFPDKTSQVWKLPEGLIKEGDNELVWDFEHEGEIMHLAQVAHLIYRHPGYYGRTSLYMPYLPYARQDKDVSNTATFALHTFMLVLDTFGFDNITAFDPHSRVSGVMAVQPQKEIQVAVDSCHPDMVCFPDKGALTRYNDLIPRGMLYIHANKKRNQETGEIIGTELVGNPEGSSVLIVDDICDGGMTFIKLAAMLYEFGATEVNLYVSHGIFSKGLQVLRDAGIKRIFTKDGEVK